MRVYENRVPVLVFPLRGFYSIWGITGVPLVWEMPIFTEEVASSACVRFSRSSAAAPFRTRPSAVAVALRASLVIQGLGFGVEGLGVRG